MRRFALTTSLIALAAGAAAAQEAPEAPEGETIGDGEIRAIEGWTYDDVYERGWSADEFIDEMDVVGVDGEEIGDVENLIFGADGTVLAVIAEVGGFWDIGDTHVSVPWSEVTVGDGIINVPVDEDNVGDYSIFGEGGFYFPETAQEVQAVDDDLTAGEGVFKATDLIGDYAYLTGGERYGYVNDVLVQDGKIAAVVIDAGAYGTPGYYAYPYAGYGYGYGYRDGGDGMGAGTGMDAGNGTGTGMGYGPNSWRYGVGYGADDITVIDTFDYDQMKGSGATEGSQG